jgi:hypothetical protein
MSGWSVGFGYRRQDKTTQVEQERDQERGTEASALRLVIEATPSAFEDA